MGTHGRTRWTGPETGSHHAVPIQGWRARLPLVLLGAGAVLLLGAGLLVGLALAPGPAGATPGSTGAEVPAAAATTVDARSGDPAAAGAADGSHPTLFGEVVRVDAGDEVVVRVRGADVRVAVLGIAAPRAAGPGRSGECGAAAALRFADDQLADQMVTLVPDPTVPEVDDEGRRLAYVVLPSQLNYTDDALLAGVVRADTSRGLTYGDVFERAEATAREDERGLWGAPCLAEPGQPLRTGS